MTKSGCIVSTMGQVRMNEVIVSRVKDTRRIPLAELIRQAPAPDAVDPSFNSSI